MRQITKQPKQPTVTRLSAGDGLPVLMMADQNMQVPCLPAIGIEFLSVGETPGLGTKVQDDSFLSKLKGFGVDTDENSNYNHTAAT